MYTKYTSSFKANQKFNFQEDTFYIFYMWYFSNQMYDSSAINQVNLKTHFYSQVIYSLNLPMNLTVKTQNRAH